jgi:hypothetical protein
LTMYLVVWQNASNLFMNTADINITFYYDHEPCGPARIMHKSSRAYF